MNYYIQKSLCSFFQTYYAKTELHSSELNIRAFLVIPFFQPSNIKKREILKILLFIGMQE